MHPKCKKKKYIQYRKHPNCLTELQQKLNAVEKLKKTHQKVVLVYVI